MLEQVAVEQQQQELILLVRIQEQLQGQVVQE
jgi:hypothetical protein